jgi:hypothetical protein
MSKFQFELGQWVVVKAQVITARRYKTGMSRDNFYAQGKRWYPLCPDDWTVIHEPENTDCTQICLLRRELPPKQMMVVGRTWRCTGYYFWSGSSEDAPFMIEDKRHTVYMLRSGLQWTEPVLALAEDMRVLTVRERFTREGYA